jgi:hypothetical protein
MKRKKRNHIEWECQQLLNRSMVLMDAGDWEALARCYTKDGKLARPSNPGNPITGRDAILESLRARPERVSCHMLSDCVFDVHDEETVTAYSRVWLMTAEPCADSPAAAGNAIMVGSFTDTLVLTKKGWLIRERQGGIEMKYAPA